MTTTEKLCALLRERHEAGLEKYGVTLDRGDYTAEQWIQHALEELLDGAGYLMRLRDAIYDLRGEIDTKRDRIRELEATAENLLEQLELKTPETTRCECHHGYRCVDCAKHAESRKVIAEARKVIG